MQAEAEAKPAAAAEAVVEDACSSNADCVHGGVCQKAAGEDAQGSCLCFRSCSRGVPLECTTLPSSHDDDEDDDGDDDEKALSVAGTKNHHCVSSKNLCNMELGMCVCPSGPVDKCAKSALILLLR